MNEKIKRRLIEYNEKNGWGITDEDLIETLKESKRMYCEEIEEHRWWKEYQYVHFCCGIFIGYIDAESTGDESARERGYEFDKSTICEMVPIKKTIIVYEKKEAP